MSAVLAVGVSAVESVVSVYHDWDWVGVRGTAHPIGPDDLVDAADGFDMACLSELLREVLSLARGTHDDCGRHARRLRDD